MHCDWMEQLGAYQDGQLSAAERHALEAHLGKCRVCAEESGRLRALARAFAGVAPVQAPPGLWSAIEARLDCASAEQLPAPVYRLYRRPLVAAAGLALLIGTGALLTTLINESANVARAGMVDYSILLDGVAADVDAAVERFFARYGAVPLAQNEVAAAVPALRFTLPLRLPGGFELEQSYRLQFGAHAGAAARYRRGDEPLVLFFHPPMEGTRFGVHRESSCHVAGREGSRVEAGPWRLLHFTDPQTCHCLLSRLSEQEQLEVMKAVAIALSRSPPEGH
jgi:anti-sigma factor RsiW